MPLSGVELCQRSEFRFDGPNTSWVTSRASLHAGWLGALSRGLAGFLLFLGLVLLVLGGFAIYLGPNGLAFVLHAERSTAPFVMVNLLDFDSRDAQRRYMEEYGRPTLEMIESLGGRVLWQAELVDVAAGRSTDHWPLVVFVEYPSRAAFIDLVTSSEYRDELDAREQSLARTALLAGTPRQAFDEGGAHFALRLLHGSEDGWRRAYANEWRNEDIAIVEQHDGWLAWQASLNPLVAAEEDRFEELYLFAFSSDAGRRAWVDDLERHTTRSLEQRLFDRDVILLLDPSSRQ